jgi:hypothetical protein
MAADVHASRAQLCDTLCCKVSQRFNVRSNPLGFFLAIGEL